MLKKSPLIAAGLDSVTFKGPSHPKPFWDSITPFQLWDPYQHLGSVFLENALSSGFFWEPVATWPSKLTCKAGTINPEGNHRHHSKTLTFSTALHKLGAFIRLNISFLNFLFSVIQDFCFLFKMSIL